MGILSPEQRRSTHVRKCVDGFVIALFLIFLFALPVRAASPFDGLAGSWSGGGSISTGENRERISCRATYRVAGTSVEMSLRCASASYNINASGSMRASGNSISGEFSESSYGVSGTLSGRASGGNISARISGGFSATLSVNTSGRSQSISLISENARVSIGLRR